MKKLSKLLVLMALILSLTLVMASCDFFGNKDTTQSGDNTNEPPTPVQPLTPSEGLDFEDRGVYYAVVGLGTCTDKTVVIPDTYYDKPVKVIGTEAFSDGMNSKEDTTAKTIIIPNSVVAIEEYAFGGEYVESVSISASVSSIGKYAFAGAIDLKSINVDEDNKNYKSVNGNLYSKDGKEFIAYAAGKTDTVFAIEPGVERIEDGAVLCAFNLQDITIPEGVTSIGEYAFAYCVGATNLVVPDSVTDCSASFFTGYSDSMLQTVKLGKGFSVQSKGQYDEWTNVYEWFDFIFGDLQYLKSIEISEENAEYKSIDGVVYSKDGKTLIKYPNGKTNSRFTIPADVEKICSYAFSKVMHLTSLTFNTNIKEIEQSALGECWQLEGTIPDWVLEIQPILFDGGDENGSDPTPTPPPVDTPSPDTITPKYELVNNSYYIVTGYEGNNFDDTLGEIYIKIPSEYNGKSVKKIADGAFKGLTINENCYVKLLIDEGVSSIGAEAFAFTGQGYFEIPSTVTSIGEKAFVGWMAKPSISESNSVYSAYGECILSKDGTKLIFCTTACRSQYLHIPETVKEICEYAFAGCNGYTDIYIPDHVEKIAKNAFDNSYTLASVYIGGNAKFESLDWLYCSEFIVDIAVSANNEYYMAIDGNLYTKDGKTLIRYASGNYNSTFAVPDGVEVIGEKAFAYAVNLRSITIPDSVHTIGENAFIGCNKALEACIPNTVVNLPTQLFGDE